VINTKNNLRVIGKNMIIRQKCGLNHAYQLYVNE
jgi:hypothetical protein